MKRKPVNSSMVASLGWMPDPITYGLPSESIGTLEVEFRNGTIGQYAHVPIKVFKTIKTSKSIGSTLHRLVKAYPERFPWRETCNAGDRKGESIEALA